MTAALSDIFRHPIKAHGYEALTSTRVLAGRTLPWDRHWAVLHEHAKTDGTAWAPCVNFSRGAKAGSLMAISAKLDETSHQLSLTHPELGPLQFEPDTEADRFLDWVRPLMPRDRAASSGIVAVPDRGMTDTDFPSISLAGRASLAALSEKMGQPLDPRRFRANFWIEGLSPWEGFELVGQRVRIGNVTFEVRERITRCRATMANPETGKTDADTLGALEAGWGHTDFGVYLVAENSGEVATGDVFEVLG